VANNNEWERRRAIERWERGESPAAIYGSMGYSQHWFYTWLERYRSGDPEWFCERSRRPHSSPCQAPQAIEESVILVRLSLYNRGLFPGAQAIRWELDELQVRPLPSVRTINRIVARHALTHRRTGRYEPKGRKYPTLRADKPGAVHQSDFVGPCYLSGPVRFYSLHSVDVATRRCGIEPLLTRSAQPTLDALWATWMRLGMPRHQQVDNEMVFYGSQTHPRGMGSLIRLCLLHRIEVWFIPPGEPWRNGIVEKFNDHWQQKFKDRVPMHSEAELRQQSPVFEQRHNTLYRYSPLGGKTPAAALAASGVALRFPPTAQAPRHPLPKPEQGRYHLVRFIRNDGVLDIFGEKFSTPPAAAYEYVRATVDVRRQRLLVFLDDVLIDEHPYNLR
jgi:transposase InsO family protein